MSSFKVERDDDAEQKSVQEVEEQLLKDKEAQDALSNPPADEPKNDDQPAEEPKVIEINDDLVLSHIKTRYGKEVNSIDELFQTREEAEELPEDVKSYLDYKKQTGRSFEDFKQLNRDFDKEDPNKLLRDFIKAENPEYDEDDVNFEMEKYAADEFDETDTKRKQMAFKKDLSKAKTYFNNLKEQFKAPLESSDSFVPPAEKETYKQYKEYKKTLEEQQAENQKRSEVYTEKTNSLFSDNFEGFDIKIGDQVLKYKPADAATLREQQSDLRNFTGKFLDETTTLKDAEGFHKAIAIATDIEKYTKFIWDTARATEAEEQAKTAKNIDMMRKSQQSTPKSGFTVEVENDQNVSTLRMKKRN